MIEQLEVVIKTVTLQVKLSRYFSSFETDFREKIVNL